MEKKIVVLFIVLSMLIVLSFSGEDVWANEANEYVKVIEFNEDDKVNNKESGKVIRVGGEEFLADSDENFELEFVFDNFRANGGPMLGLLRLDLSSLNEVLTGDDAKFKALSEDMILFGGGGVIGSREGSRIGGYGLSGKLSSSDGEKRAALEINYGGFLYQKGLFATKRTDIAFGALLGGGSTKLEMRHRRVDNAEDVINHPAGSILESSFILFEPRVDLYYKLGGFTGVELGAGYLLTYNLSGEAEIFGTKVDDLVENFSGPTITAKFSFGF
ncbi:hypothetical protein [Halonatronum saccharophilum]|uniref:hypothetical protein n=1 Tax=Halonatronum saccharophilum TaxID=150060 RepID=UPI0004813A67|nr:hypothetical protein [Halonatronum saccharophilum]